jgi:hypothetical protein
VLAASLPQYISAVRVVAKSYFDGQEALTAGRMSILQALLRAYGQWAARSFPRLTYSGGVSADIIQAIWANAMQSDERVMIRDSAAVILSYVLGLRESSVMSLPAENITRGEYYAHSSKDDRSAGVSERQGIAARVAGNVRANRSC